MRKQSKSIKHIYVGRSFAMSAIVLIVLGDVFRSFVVQFGSTVFICYSFYRFV